MRTKQRCLAVLIVFVLIVLSALCFAFPAKHPASVQQTHAEQPQLTAEQQCEFLLTAKVIRYRQTGSGITNPYRLTLSDGKITHDASFQSINERRSWKELDRGGEANFVDSYLYNLAAYELAKLIGLEDMLPVTVERKWRGRTGSLTWWLPVQMSIGQKEDKNISPPDLGAWNSSMYKVRVFTQLIYDTDRSNPDNILIGKNWEVYMIDFSRAFRLYHDLRNPEDLVCCSRKLLEKLRALDSEELAAKTGKYLTKPELEGIMKRRDKIVALFEKLIAEKGESAVLY
jgi:hypothetical protein